MVKSKYLANSGVSLTHCSPSEDCKSTTCIEPCFARSCCPKVCYWAISGSPKPMTLISTMSALTNLFTKPTSAKASRCYRSGHLPKILSNPPPNHGCRPPTTVQAGMKTMRVSCKNHHHLRRKAKAGAHFQTRGLRSLGEKNAPPAPDITGPKTCSVEH